MFTLIFHPIIVTTVLSSCVQENVSLADILSLRDSCLTEDEVWAVCGECALALQSISLSALFHSLCITPDTLAFNAHGNVCFMEQLSDDPEGSFIPPEFDSMGSTFEGHVFSLGSTLSAALSFVIEPELESDLGPELSGLLEQMQQEAPEDRPDVLSLAQSHLSHTSSTAVCRRLSSAGRRVLSIESFQGHPFSLCLSPSLCVRGSVWLNLVLITLFVSPQMEQKALGRRVLYLVPGVYFQWIPLRELLTRCGRRLSVNELWALCYTCLSSLQTYIDFPGYCDEFYLAPEYQEHGIVTEKVGCVSLIALKTGNNMRKVSYNVFVFFRYVSMASPLFSGPRQSSAYRPIRSWRCPVN
uniref:KIND domain-containing protein n=1 Tax=Neogobius melanostomus TaxID=47308 RepID=A0A8C6USC7_9GOBI